MIDQLIGLVKKYYKKIPLPLLNLAAPLFYLIPAKFRYGQVFTETWNALEQEELLTEAEQAELVNRRFREIIAHCFRNVPYYREEFARLGLTPEDFQTVADIVKLPVIDKETIRLHGEKMLAENLDRTKLITKSTSGSTGLPLTLYFEKSTEMREWANVMHIWKRVGYRWDSSRATFRSNKSFQDYKETNHYWDATRKELRCNIHNMDDLHCEEYCRAIEKYKPEFIYGYPSSIFQFCKYVSHRQLHHQFRAALIVSETLTEEMRAYIERILHLKTYIFYGHTERAAMAAPCEFSRSYHVVPSYGYVELLDKDGSQIFDDSIGEIVVTGFTNYAMPLLRYRTADLAQWDTGAACPCGRPGPRLKTIVGRTADFFYTKDGILQNVNAYTYSAYHKFKILQFQFRQSEYGKVDMYIVVDSGYSPEDAAALRQFMQKESEGQVEFTIHLCDHIPAGDNGKVRMVVQNIKI